jgi:hypothetical protein
MKNHVTKLFVALAVLATVFVITGSVEAQRRLQPNAYTRGQVDLIIHNAETRSDFFVTEFDRSLDHSRLNGSAREDQLNRRAKDLEGAFDNLRRRFDRTESYWATKAEVARCLNIATDINAAMRSHSFGPVTERNWAALRIELNTLARVYGVPGVGSARY